MTASHRRRSGRLLLALGGLASGLVPSLGEVPGSNAAVDRPVVNVGLVYDGPPPGGEGVVPERLKGLAELIEQETSALTGQEFDVRFPADKRLSGAWSVEEIRATIDRQLADPQVQIVVILGIFSTQDVCRRGDLPKPVIAPYAVDVEAQSLPFDIDADGRLITGVRNLNYLTAPGTIMRDLRRFREIVPFSRVHVLTDALVPEIIPEIPRAVIAGGRALGAEILPPVLVIDSAEDALAALPSDTEAVYVTPLHRMPDDEFAALTEGLIRRKLPSFSLIGRDEVEQGLMAGVRPETDFERLARRIALNIQRILLGEDAGDLPITLELQQKLVINMATATAIGVFPNFRVAREAELIRVGAEEIDETLTLAQAVREAVEANLGLRAAERDVAAGAEEIRRARSALKPRLDASTLGLQIDGDRAEASFGSQAERTIVAGLSLSQILFSDGARSNLEISRRLHQALELDWETRRLDVALEAAVAFLDLLRAETLERIERENLRLTESNLELARRREQIGFSGPADVYRWQSRLATNRSDLIRAHSAVHLAFVVLNQILNRPMEELYDAEEPVLVDPELVTGFRRLNRYVDNAASFMLFKEFMVRDGLAASPELRAIDATIAAQERALRGSRRSFWSPELALVADAEKDVSRDGKGSSAGSISPLEPADRTDWSVGVRATLPLYSGGARRAAVRQDREQLAALRLERRAIAERVEQRVRATLYAMTATYSAIELTEEAAEAARQNLELVTDSYASGVVSIIDLLDAQNAALVAEALAANAEFDFLIDLMRLQRATSRFDFFDSDAGRKAWFDRLEAYFSEHADRIRWPKR